MEQQKYTFADIVAAYGGLYGSIDVWCEDVQGEIGAREEESWAEFYPATYAKSEFFRQYFGFTPYSKDRNTVYITVRAKGKVAAQFLKYKGKQKRKFRAILVGWFTSEKKVFSNGETGDRIVLDLKTFDGIQSYAEEQPERKPYQQEQRPSWTPPQPVVQQRTAYVQTPKPPEKKMPARPFSSNGLPPGISIV